MAKRNKAEQSAEAADQSKGRSRKQAKSGRIEAMRHPLRERILRLLSDRGVMSPAQLSRALKADLSNVSYHMRRLEELQCVEQVDTRPVRGALEHFYRATERPLIDTDEFEELHPTVAENMLCQAIQRILDDFVGSRKARMVGFDQHFHVTRTPLLLDEEGYQEGMSAFERFRAEMSEVERRSAERRDVSSPPPIAVSSNLLFFKIPSASLET